ncbi:ATP-dependent nuclease [Aquabacterium sp.]|uniref:ATP-dependent nuclease n=1 Tax=Aquabacterium sp. TaxID=1872578 RepID=UPI003784BB35
MKYHESNKDKKLRTWFGADLSKALLRRIQLEKGVFRGLNALDLAFTFPISAVCGKNGAGKSTITALACCAFHNAPSGYKLPKRRNSYYTFSDFFVQHPTESPPSDVSIVYEIAHDQWKPTPKHPDGKGLGLQRRKKSKGGKWNDYDARVPRTVVFLGIERVVPHTERSQSRSYSRAFKDVPLRGWESQVMDAVGYVLAKKYDDFRYVVHSKYSLPIVKCGKVIYSGFNMGAGENALFDIFSIIYSAGPGALIVVDEIELGLHVEAQRRLVDKLKDVCESQKIQVICTTHSSDILDALPTDARIYIESVSGTTRITRGISSDFAFSKLSAVNGQEADILVEDDVARALVLAALPASMRTRVTVKDIGSANALSRQLAAVYLRGETRPVIAVFDGDQLPKESSNLAHARSMAEKAKPDFDAWFSNRAAYLPGDYWPEFWLLKRAAEIPATLAKLLGTEKEDLLSAVEYGLQAGKHRELYEFAKQLGLEREHCLHLLSTAVVQEFDDEFTAVVLRIQQRLEGDG